MISDIIDFNNNYWQNDSDSVRCIQEYNHDDKYL